MDTVIDGRHAADTVRVLCSTLAGACRTPGCRSDRHTLRACAPPYQPIRNASAVKPGVVVDTNSRKLPPGSTLTWSAYPTISCSAPLCRIRHPGVPGCSFSLFRTAAPAVLAATGRFASR